MEEKKQKDIGMTLNSPSNWVVVWYELGDWWKNELVLSDDDRYKHFYMIWQLWTWKSTMIFNQAISDIYNWKWVCVIDTYWDLSEKILKYYPKDRIDDLIYFDLSNIDYIIWLNPFNWAKSEGDKNIITDDILDMFVDIYWLENFTPIIQDYFRNACLLLLHQNDGSTLLDIIRLFMDDIFVETRVKNINDPILASWWYRVYAKKWNKQKNEIFSFIQSKLSPFMTSSYIRRVLWQPKTEFDFNSAIHDNKVILCKFPKWIIWEINSEFMCRLVLIQLKQAILKRVNMTGVEKYPFFVYLDDFQQYIPKKLWIFLADATKANVWIIMANQSLDQLQIWNFGLSRMILNNVWNVLAYRLWSLDSEILGKYFFTNFSKNDLSNLENFKWIIKLNKNWIQSNPSLITTKFHLDASMENPDDRVKTMKQISSLKRWTKRDLVDREIYYRIGL